jgi:hypothetical protein
MARSKWYVFEYSTERLGQVQRLQGCRAHGSGRLVAAAHDAVGA